MTALLRLLASKLGAAGNAAKAFFVRWFLPLHTDAEIEDKIAGVDDPDMTTESGSGNEETSDYQVDPDTSEEDTGADEND